MNNFMEIEFSENLNVFYLFTILNLIGYDDDNGMPFHEIRTKIRTDLARYKTNPSVLRFKRMWEKHSMYPTPYWLVVLALHSNDGFSKIDIEYGKTYLLSLIHI